MKTRLIILLAFIAVCFQVDLMGQLPPVRRSPWTTNAPGASMAYGTNISVYNMTNRPLVYNSQPLTVHANTGVPGLLVESNGWVAIGIATPVVPLHVDGQIRGRDFYNYNDDPSIFFDDTTVGAEDYVFWHNTNYFKIINASDARTDIAISADGYVGINTNDPLTKLHVLGAAMVEPEYYYTVPLTIYNNLAQPSFVVNSNGYVGVGTNNPSYQLSLANGSGNQLNVNAIGDSGQDFLLGYSASANTWQFWAESGRGYEFLVNSLPVVSIDDSTSYVGIGTNSPAYELSVKHVTADRDEEIEIGNDAQSWLLQVYGTSLDDFRLVDPTHSSRVPIGVAAADGVVYVAYGLHSTNSTACTVLGYSAGSTGMTNGVAVGYQAGGSSLTNQNSVNVGKWAGVNSVYCANSVMNGFSSGFAAVYCYSSVFDGNSAGNRATNCYQSVFLGDSAGSSTTNCANSVMVGVNSGNASTNNPSVVFVGTRIWLSRTSK